MHADNLVLAVQAAQQQQQHEEDVRTGAEAAASSVKSEMAATESNVQLVEDQLTIVDAKAVFVL